MEQWEKIVKRRLIKNFLVAAVGMINYIIISLLLLLSLQAGAPGIVYIFLVLYIIILLGATIKMYKLLNALRIDLSRGTSEAEYCEIESVIKSRLIIKVKDAEKVLYLPKMFRNNKNLVSGKKTHVTYLQRSKTVIQIK